MFNKFFSALKKTRAKLTDNIVSILKGKTKIDNETLEELEEILISADVGVETTFTLLEKLQTRVKKIANVEQDTIYKCLEEEIKAILHSEEGPLIQAPTTPTVILFIGVNGTGKTTTIAKVAHHLLADNKKVMLAACDTFRAAAVEQLEIWSNRLSIPMIKHSEGADPAAVAFDAVEAATARNIDYLLIDTAGRLHNKINLMEELKKIKRTIQKKLPEAPHETILVLDAVTGQNGLIQAKEFKKAIGLSGIIVTKLDGTAKGGIILAIKQELNIPIKFIGTGEKIENLEKFSSAEFAEALIE